MTLPVDFGVNPSVSLQLIRPDKGFAASAPLTGVGPLVVVAPDVSLQVSHLGKCLLTGW